MEFIRDLRQKIVRVAYVLSVPMEIKQNFMISEGLEGLLPILKCIQYLSIPLWLILDE
jgi:hypothetical protein